MFAPKVTRPQAKTGGRSTSQSEPHHSSHSSRPLGDSTVEQAAFQDTFGDLADRGFLRQSSRLTEAGQEGHTGTQADPTSAALGNTPDLTWDFSDIPIHPANLSNGSQVTSLLASPLAPSAIQSKLEVGSVDDRLEHEADRIADQVLMTPSAGGLSVAPLAVQQTTGQTSEQLSASPASVERALSISGRPLEGPLRHDMERRFGYDFSGVRVHCGAAADESARDVNALAYTVGPNIVFGAGRFAPATQDGTKLLAHELAHVIQGATQNGILRRAPDPSGAHTQPDEAKLRVTIVEGLDAKKRSSLEEVSSAIARGDRAYLTELELTPKQVDILLGNPGTQQYKMTFGTAAELALEKAIRFDSFLSQHIKRGPVGRVPRGVGKPDWRIETPSSSIPVDLMTPNQVESKLEMWRRQWRRGKPKWYIENGLNTTYERPTPKPPIDLHQGGMRQRQPPMELHQGGLPPKQAPINLHRGGLPERQPPIEQYPGGMPLRQSPMDLHKRDMPARQPPMDLHQSGMPKPAAIGAPVRPRSALKAGLKLGGTALGWALASAGLGYLVNRKLESDLKETIDRARNGAMRLARKIQSEDPSKPVYMMVKVRSGEDTRFVPLVGFLTEMKLDMISMGWVREEINPPTVEVHDTRLTSIWHPHELKIVTYTELLLPSLNEERQAEAERQAFEATAAKAAERWKTTDNAEIDGLSFSSGKSVTADRLLSWARQNYRRMFDDPSLVQNIMSSNEFIGSQDARSRAVGALRRAAAMAAAFD